ncbi:hypothetical protein MUU51_00080, partial [Scandinavium sp. H17S15]|nr:hypothetical protein [Scandinavium manionii]MCS2168778.1 hypothetical protein [Scandinavium tedordense]
GGTTPFISTALVEFTGNKLAPAYYLVGVALFTTVAVALFYRERSGASPELDEKEYISGWPNNEL